MKKLIDLHVHTNSSDGAYFPKEIIDMAMKNNVKILSITDHDTIDAYTEELLIYAKLNNITLIPGVEISTKINKCGIHVLGYNISINDENFKYRLNELRNSRHVYLFKVADKLEELGYIVNLNELDKIESVTKSHISQDVVSNILNHSLLKKEFGHIPNKGEFIETIMNENCPAYVKKETITPVEAAELIRNAGGKVVLAHPVAYKYEDGLNEKEILQIVNDMKADAVEANYIYVDKNNKKIDECNEWNEFCKSNNLISTIGSDFHELDDVRPTVGLVGENVELSSDYMTEIMKFLEDIKFNK